MYRYSMQEVKNTQDRIHAQFVLDAAENERTLLLELVNKDPPHSIAQSNSVVEQLTLFTNTVGEHVVQEWRNLLPRLITT